MRARVPMSTLVDKAGRWERLRRRIGFGAFALAIPLIAWLPLGAFGVLPFLLALPGESQLRVHGAAAVGCLMVAAWGFWED